MALAVGAVALSVRPPAPPRVDLVVAAADLAAGQVLAAGDLEVIEVPPGSVPDGAVEVAMAQSGAGEVLAAPLRRGEPLTDARLIGPGMLPGATSSGEVALPVRLTDPEQAALLDPGDRIDLLATDPAARTTETVAAAVTVLAVPAQAGGELVSGAGTLGGRLVVVAVPESVVAAVTSASVASFVTFLWSQR